MNNCTHPTPATPESQILTLTLPKLKAAFPEYFDQCKPYHASLTSGLWHVEGTLPPNTVGGTPEADIRDADKTILSIYHTK